MKILSKPSLALTAAAMLGLAACSNERDANQTAAVDTAAATDMAAAPTESATPDSHAAQFLTDAMKGDNSEVKLGKLAASQGSSAGVKDFGNMLVEDHGKAKVKVAALARDMGVPTTEETKPEADAEYAKLQGLSGDAFDKEFVSYMVEDHKKDIAKFKDEANSDDPAPLTRLAADTVPTLEKHLEKAQSLQ
jgi:putative membrane protein